MKIKNISIVCSVLLLISGAVFGEDQDMLKTATFAGGCFWCMQPPFDRVNGVKETIVGYTGGHTKNPAYYDVVTGNTGHAESIQIKYNPHIVSYEELLDVFWMNIDPTTPDRQFVDVGSQYRPAIFYHDQEQKNLAQESLKRLDSSGRFKSPIKTEITKAGAFYRAEVYHQEYYKKKPLEYNLYRFGSGRDQYLKRIWGKQYKH